MAEFAREAVAVRLADALGRDNPRFDRERFLKACGVLSPGFFDGYPATISARGCLQITALREVLRKYMKMFPATVYAGWTRVELADRARALLEGK
jgi:hypothetical protein